VHEHRTAISFFWREEPKEKAERIKDSRFKMRPEGHPAKHIRVPERDGVMYPYLIIQEFLHAKVKGNEIGSGKPMSLNNDIPKKEKTEST